MMKKQILTVLSVVALGLSVQAAPFINGQITWSGTAALDTSDFDTGSLGTATSVDLVSGEDNALTIFASAFNGGDAYASSELESFEIPDLTTFNGFFNDTFSFDGFTFNFGLVTTTSQTVGVDVLGLLAYGTVTHAGFAATPFQMSFSFTKTEESSSVGYSGTISSGDNIQQVPDAGGTVALLGIAVAGIALLPRRKA